jgi:hypothetical protein
MIPMSCSFVLPGAAWHHLADQPSATARGTLLVPPAPEHPALSPTTTTNNHLIMRFESSPLGGAMVVDRSLMAEADAMAVIRIIHLITE